MGEIKVDSAVLESMMLEIKLMRMQLSGIDPDTVVVKREPKPATRPIGKFTRKRITSMKDLNERVHDLQALGIYNPQQWKHLDHFRKKFTKQ